MPISDQTATVVIAQQQRFRIRYPHTPVGELKLLPTDRRNPGECRAITGFPSRSPIAPGSAECRCDTTLMAYDKTEVVLYAYRHTYAQRHADAGVPVEVPRADVAPQARNNQ